MPAWHLHIPPQRMSTLEYWEACPPQPFLLLRSLSPHFGGSCSVSHASQCKGSTAKFDTRLPSPQRKRRSLRSPPSLGLLVEKLRVDARRGLLVRGRHPHDLGSANEIMGSIFARSMEQGRIEEDRARLSGSGKIPKYLSTIVPIAVQWLQQHGKVGVSFKTFETPSCV